MSNTLYAKPSSGVTRPAHTTQLITIIHQSRLLTLDSLDNLINALWVASHSLELRTQKLAELVQRFSNFEQVLADLAHVDRGVEQLVAVELPAVLAALFLNLRAHS